MTRLVVVCLLLSLCGASIAGGPATAPKYTFGNVTRSTASGGTEVVTASNGTLRICPVGADTVGQCKDCVWIGGPKNAWTVQVDSTWIYAMYETTGPDSVVTGYDAMPLWGSGLRVAPEAVDGKALAPGDDGSFAPGRSFLFRGTDTLLVRYVARDSTGTLIHLLSPTQAATVQVDTAGYYTIGKDMRSYGGALSSHVLAIQVGDDVVVRADSLYASDARVDTLSAGPVDAATLSTTGTVTVGDGSGTDSLTVRGDVRARGGDFFAGTAGQAGTVSISDGSANKTTIQHVSWGTDNVLSLPIFFVDVKLANVRYHEPGCYSYGVYVAGLDSSWVAITTRSSLYDPGGATEELDFPSGASAANVTRPYWAHCQTDSLIVTTHSCCAVEDALTHLWVLVGKKNLWRRAL